MKKVLICLASLLSFMALNCDKNNYCQRALKTGQQWAL